VKKNINKCKNLKNKRHFKASKAITDMVIKRKEPNLRHLHHRQTCYQLSYCGELMGASFYESYEVTVKKVKIRLCIMKKQWHVKTNILSRKSEEGPLLPYCKLEPKSERNN
jgi:hypothetical protein